LTTAQGGPSDGAAPAPVRGEQRTRSRKAFGLALASNLGVMGLTFVTGTLNARLLGPGGRGELSAIQNVASTASMLAMIGMPSAVGFYSSRQPGDARAITTTAAILCLLSCLPFVAATYALMPVLLRSQSPQVVASGRMFLLLLFLQPAIALPLGSLQGLSKFRIWSLLRIAPNVAATAAILTAWMSGAVTSGVVSRHYLVGLTVAMPLVYVALAFNSRGAWSFRRDLAPRLIRYGLPSAVMIPAGVVNLQLDQLVMAAWFPSAMLGLYAVSVSWSALMSPLFTALGAALFPALAAVDDPAERQRMVAPALRSSVAVGAVLGAGLALVTPLLIPLFFGARFAPAVPTALILVAAGVALNVVSLCGELLRGLGAPRWPLYGQLAALPVTVGVMALLLPLIGMAGAAVASLLAYSTAAYVNVLGISRCCGLPLRELLIPRRSDVARLASHLKALVARQFGGAPRRG